MNDIIHFKERSDYNIVILTSIYITSLLANLAVGYRYINLGILIQSGGIFIFPISFIVSNIIAERYGSALAKKILYYGIMCQSIFAGYAYLIVHLPAPDFLMNKDIYYQVFNPYLNFAMASTISILIGAWLNIVLLSKFSEYVGGKYFAARSFFASSIGELVVTVVSMIIANYGRLDNHQLVYMIACCFLVKTLISLIAIWPAAIVVYLLQENNDTDISLTYDNLKTPFLYLRTLAIISWTTRSYLYNLESINLNNTKTNLYFKGSRASVELNLNKVVMNTSIISKTSPRDASYIGYYYGFLIDKEKKLITWNLSTNMYLKKGYCLNISSISRNGMLNIIDNDGIIFGSFNPKEIYEDKSFITKFDSSQALYIGYLTGESHRLGKNNISNNKAPKLTLVK